MYIIYRWIIQATRYRLIKELDLAEAGYLVTEESFSSKLSSSSTAMFSFTTMTPDPCGRAWEQVRRKLTRSSIHRGKYSGTEAETRNKRIFLEKMERQRKEHVSLINRRQEV